MNYPARTSCARKDVPKDWPTKTCGLPTVGFKWVMFTNGDYSASFSCERHSDSTTIPISEWTGKIKEPDEVSKAYAESWRVFREGKAEGRWTSWVDMMNVLA